MAYYSKNGTGIDSNAYIYVQLQVTRTDYATYSHFELRSVAVSDTGTSSFIRGQVTKNQAGNSWTSATNWKSVSYNGTTTLATATFDVTRGDSSKTAVCKAYAEGGGTGIYAGGTDTATLNVTVPAIVYEVPNPPTNATSTRNSATKATAAWTNGSTTTVKPRTAVLLERSTDGGSWSQIAALAASASSYADTTVTAGHYYRYRVRSQNSAGYSDYATSTTYAVTVPNAPSSCSATRNSDSKATVTWTNGSSGTTNTRANVLIERQTDGGSWTQLASLAASTTSYTDNGISSNHRYAYRVRSSNAAGYSSYATSGYIYTTPAAPTAVSVSKTADTTVSITATVSAPYATGYDVQRSTDSGSTWTSIASNSALPVTDTVAGTARWRVRSVRGSLASSWKSSSDVTTIVAPNAPTITAKPSSPMVEGGTATIRWTPNHPDGTSQTKAQVRITNPSGTQTTAEVSGSTTSYTFTPDATGTWTAQVRTYGLAESWGAWSNSISWGVYALPIVTITSPSTDGEDIATMPLTIEWSIIDPTGVASQSIALRDDTDGRNILSRQLDAASRTFTVTTSDVALIDGHTYIITLQVGGGSGLSASAARSFDVAWALPAAPSAEISEAEGAAASIVVTANEGDTETESITVQRINPDGTTWTVASGLSSEGEAIDPLPPLGVEVSYLVTASATSGASASATFTATFGGCKWALNFGSTAEIGRLVGRNPSYDEGYTHGGELYHFARGTQDPEATLPVFYPTGTRDGRGSLEFDAETRQDAEDLLEILFRYPVCWMRTPFGKRRKIRISPSYKLDRKTKRISVSWDMVQFTEAWNG